MKNLLFVIALALGAFSAKAQSKPSVAVLDFDTRGYNEV
jgi:Skp family chaperone for outer membrane proteins